MLFFQTDLLGGGREVSNLLLYFILVSGREENVLHFLLQLLDVVLVQLVQLLQVAWVREEVISLVDDEAA